MFDCYVKNTKFHSKNVQKYLGGSGLGFGDDVIVHPGQVALPGDRARVRLGQGLPGRRRERDIVSSLMSTKLKKCLTKKVPRDMYVFYSNVPRAQKVPRALNQKNVCNNFIERRSWDQTPNHPRPCAWCPSWRFSPALPPSSKPSEP